jgi:predicted HicB family RNase H-like nuclease
MAKKKKGRPPKQPQARKGHFLQVRLGDDEKQAFTSAAELAGIDVSTWVRERLRLVARRELEEGGKPVEFLKQKRHG